MNKIPINPNDSQTLITLLTLPPQAGAYISYKLSLKETSKRKTARKTYSNTLPEDGTAWSTQYKDF
jgi:hypothetical protein